MIQNSLHVRLLVLDYQASLHFYRDILGFPTTWEDGDYASFQEGGMRLGIFKRPLMSEVLETADKPLEAASQDTFALIFEVPDVDNCYRDLQDKGVVFEKEPQNFPGWGIRAGYFRDPDGNLIEINSGLKGEE